MKRYAGFTECDLLKIKEEINSLLEIDLDNEIESYINFSGNVHFERKLDSIFTMLNAMGERIDKKLSINYDIYADHLYNGFGFDSNYFTIHERRNPKYYMKYPKNMEIMFPAKDRNSLSFNCSPNGKTVNINLNREDNETYAYCLAPPTLNMYVSKIIEEAGKQEDEVTDEDIEKEIKTNIKIKEISKEEELRQYIDGIRNADKSFWNRNNEFGLAEYQITKLLKSNCFVQDILYNIYYYMVLNQQEIERGITDSQIQEKYVIDISEGKVLDFKKNINNLRQAEIKAVKKGRKVPMSIVQYEDGKAFKCNKGGIDVLVTYIANKNYYNLYDIDHPTRDECSYQNIYKIIKILSKDIFKDHLYENMFLLEKTIGVNVGIHIYHFMESYYSDGTEKEVAKEIVQLIMQYPNVFTRIFVLDEILCLFSGNDKYTLVKIKDVLLDMIKENLFYSQKKYDMMSKIVFYYLHKINIPGDSSSNGIKSIIKTILKQYREDDRPWSISHYEGVLINSLPARTVNDYFKDTEISRVKKTELYKSIQNEIIKEIIK